MVIIGPKVVAITLEKAWAAKVDTEGGGGKVPWGPQRLKRQLMHPQSRPGRTPLRSGHNRDPGLPNGYLALKVPNLPRVGTYLPRYPGG